MNKAQLVEELSGRFEGNKKQAQHALESVIDVIQRTLVKGEKVAITGFGSFEKIDRAARTARNPATGAAVKVKKTSVARFRPGAELKAIVSGAKKLPKVATGAASAATGSARGAAGTRRSAAAGASDASKTTSKRVAGTRASKATSAAGTSATDTLPAKKASSRSSTASKASATAAKRSAAKNAPAKRTAKKA